MIIEDLQHLYQTYAGVAAETITELPSSGSNRRYFRLTGTQNLIGVYGTSIEENNAFLYMPHIFAKKAFLFPKSIVFPQIRHAICKKT